MSVDNPEQLKQKALNKFHQNHEDGDIAIHELAAALDAYYKAQASKDMADVIGIPFEPSGFDNRYVRHEGVDGHISHYESEADAKLINDFIAGQRETAASKGYKVEGE